MGWAGGSTIVERLIPAIQEAVPNDKTRKALYDQLIDAFTDADWDTVDECMGIDSVFDEAANDAGWGGDEDDEDSEE